jgi:hypothetical protein
MKDANPDFLGVKMDTLTDLKFMLGHREQPLAFDFGGRKGAPWRSETPKFASKVR